MTLKPPTQYYAHGKLLLTAEYAVIHGVTALALPTRYGQSLTLTPIDSPHHLRWKALNPDGTPWLDITFYAPDVQSNHESAEAQRLRQLLLHASRLNPEFDPAGYQAETRLQFPRHWGLGSSSTLVALLAHWAQCDAFQLFFATHSGSGYDVAVALVGRPILYTLQSTGPEYRPIDYHLPDHETLYFIHHGHKQSSEAEIHRTAHKTPDPHLLSDIQHISNKIAQTTQPDDFDYLLSHHEQLISRLIDTPPLKEQNFKNYPHLIKSLGAWGGDFFLVRANDRTDLQYFRQRGYTTILSASEILAGYA